MKPLHLFLCAALLGMLSLRSCREFDGGLNPEAPVDADNTEYSSFEGEPQNPPKDIPKDKPVDYDDWRYTQLR